MNIEMSYQALEQLEQAVSALQQQGVIGYPTEAVFGLGCDPWSETAMQRLLQLKHRAAAQGVILIAHELETLLPLLQPLTTAQLQTLEQTWPGSHTWVIPCRKNVPVWIRGAHSTLAVRVTAHPLARELCRSWGKPLVSTSANRSGCPPCLNLEQLLQQFPSLDAWLDGEVDLHRKPSTIQDLISGTVLRSGV